MPSGTFFLCLGDRRPRKPSSLDPKASHYARFWVQTVRKKTIARHILESVANLFLRILLVAPYCAIPRYYLSDTPLLRAMGFLVSQHGQLGAIPPPPFLSVSPLESMRSGGAIPPLKRGISAIPWPMPYENKANGCDTPSVILSRKCIARYGGVSRTGPLSAYSAVCHRDF